MASSVKVFSPEFVFLLFLFEIRRRNQHLSLCFSVRRLVQDMLSLSLSTNNATENVSVFLLLGVCTVTDMIKRTFSLIT